MRTFSRSLAIVLIAVAAFIIGCSKEQTASDGSTFAFVVYPGAKYYAQLTDLFKQAHKVIKPNEEPPPTAVYDTDAPLEDVATYYAQQYGYGKVAADSTNNLSAARPAAYYRTGDLNADAKATQEQARERGSFCPHLLRRARHGEFSRFQRHGRNRNA